MAELTERKPVVSLILLLFAQTVLLSVQVRTESGDLLVAHWGLVAFTPVAAGLDALQGGLADNVEKASGIFSALSENQRLRAENARLKMELGRLSEMAEMVPRVEAYEALRRQLEQRTVVAAVLWRSPPFFTNRVLVNVGSRRGVRRNASVLTPEGVAGRVWAVTPWYSEVELITNPEASAGALVGPGRVPGIVTGTGGELLRLEFVSNSEKIEAGDRVVASGGDRIHPKGMPIGTVAEAKPGPAGQMELWVRPAADFGKLGEVAVVLFEDLPLVELDTPQERSAGSK